MDGSWQWQLGVELAWQWAVSAVEQAVRLRTKLERKGTRGFFFVSFRLFGRADFISVRLSYLRVCGVCGVLLA